MKTTIELPPELLRRSKALAATRGTSLKALVIEGLERVIGDEDLSPAERAGRVFAVMDEVGEYSASGRLTREESHER